MTISSTLRVKDYTGNGVTTLFPTVFACFAIAHVKAKHLVVATGVETDLTQGDHFSVAMNGLTTCNVTYPRAGSAYPVLPAGEKIYLYRDVPLLQGLDMRNGDDFDVELIEKQFDYLTMMVQALQEEINRAVTVDMTSGVSPNDYLATVAAAVVSATAQVALATAARSGAEAARDAAIAAASTVPEFSSMTGQAGSYARVKVGETEVEFRTPAQALSDIGAEPTDADIMRADVPKARTKPHYPASVELASNAGTLAFSLLTHESCYKKLASNASVTLGQPSDMAADLWLQVELEGTGTNTVAYHADYLKESLGALPTSIANGKHLTLCFRCTTRSGNLKMVYVGHTLEV